MTRRPVQLSFDRGVAASPGTLQIGVLIGANLLLAVHGESVLVPKGFVVVVAAEALALAEEIWYFPSVVHLY